MVCLSDCCHVQPAHDTRECQNTGWQHGPCTMQNICQLFGYELWFKICLYCHLQFTFGFHGFHDTAFGISTLIVYARAYKLTIMAVLTLHRYAGKHIAGRSSLFQPAHDKNRGLFDIVVPLWATCVNREQPTSSHLPAYLPTYWPTHTSVKHKHIYLFIFIHNILSY